MTRIVFASQNQNKIAELRLLLGEEVDLLAPSQAGVSDLQVLESGTTFKENAELKAKAYALAVNQLALADDSGLEVAALAGGPGVRSARWLTGSDADRNQGILEQLQGVADRRARFVCDLCLVNPTGEQALHFVGEVAGVIAQQPLGVLGFGYDPIFTPDGYQQTLAQLGPEIKAHISHRAKAADQLAAFLQSQSVA